MIFMYLSHIFRTFQNNQYKLTLEHYLFCFANFLLGRSLHGPGKYIFGVFDITDIEEAFKIEYNLDDWC